MEKRMETTIGKRLGITRMGSMETTLRIPS